MASWWDDNAPPGNRYAPGSPVNQPLGTGIAAPSAPTGGMDFAGAGNVAAAVAPTATAGGSAGGGVDRNNPLFQGINPQLVDYFIQHGITPTGPGSGPTDIAYLNQKMTEPGQDIGYWLNEKLPNQVFGKGGGGGGGFGSSTAPAAFDPGTFTAPTGLNYTNDPGYLERMRMGTDAIQNAAAAKGSLLSGGTLKALERYGQDYGSNEFDKVYGRALGTFGTNVNAGQLAYQNRYGQFTDYLGQLNQAANRGITGSSALYQNPPAQ